MKELDFTPEWYWAGRQRKRDWAVRVLCLGGLAVAMFLASVGRYAQTALARGDLADLQASLRSQAEVIQVRNELEQRLNELHTKRQLLSDVAGGVAQHRVLAELAQLMPQAVTLTDLRVTLQRRIGLAETGPAERPGGGPEAPVEEPVRLELAGWAASDVQVGSLMSNMGRSAVFKEVTLRYCKPVEVQGREVREFKLTSRVPQFD